MTARERILAIVRRIPKDKVMTYGQVAKLARTSPRAVGAVMRANHDRAVPCHRVVASDGSMHGYNNPKGVKEKLRRLKTEGVVLEGKKVDLKYSTYTI